MKSEDRDQQVAFMRDKSTHGRSSCTLGYEDEVPSTAAPAAPVAPKPAEPAGPTVSVAALAVSDFLIRVLARPNPTQQATIAAKWREGRMLLVFTGGNKNLGEQALAVFQEMKAIVFDTRPFVLPIAKFVDIMPSIELSHSAGTQDRGQVC